MEHSLPLSLRIFLIGCLLIAACGRESTSENLAGCERQSNEAIIRLAAEPDRLHPILTTSGYANQVNQLLFLTLESLSPTSMDMEPMLVEQRPEVRETESGGMAYTFDIHDEAVWDNGSPITGHDYLFTLKAVMNPMVNAPRLRAYMALIEAVEVDADDPRRFTVYTRERDLLGEEIVANVIPVMPAYHYDPEGLLRDIPLAVMGDEQGRQSYTDALQAFADQFSEPRFSHEADGVIGNGPYELEIWETGQRVILRKKADWWGADLADDYPALAAYPDRIIFQIIPDATTAGAVIQSEDIDVVPDLTAEAFVQLQADSAVNACYRLESFPQLASSFLSLNTRDAKLSDKRVRRAIAMSIDANEIIENLYQGFGDRLAGPVPNTLVYANKDLRLLDYQPEQARQLLSQAGWEDSNGNGLVDKMVDGELTELQLRFDIPANNNAVQQLGLMMQDQLKAAGIGLDIQAGAWSEIMAAHRAGNFEIVPMGRAYPSPTIWNPRQNYHTGGDSRTGFGTAETDALIDRILTVADDDERMELYRQLQTIIYDEQPEIYLFSPRARIALHRRFDTELIPVSPGFLPNLIRLQ